jgi:uroporphyrin-III C-methyltransferase
MKMQNKFGFVTFAGAGAGGLDNLTLGVLRAINNAQAILYDALIDNEIIALFPQKCIKICVGKRAGFHSVPQEKTNELLIKLAMRGLEIVRLKGGDPSIFARISEERDALDFNQIPHKTLAGLSAVQVAAAQFDIPLTKRGVSRSLEIITASDFNNLCQIQPQILHENKTFAFYMGGKKAAQILMACEFAKMPLDLPIAIIENAGRKNAIFNYGTLSQLSEICQNQDNGPILILMGYCVQFNKIEQNEIFQSCQSL